MIKLMNDKLIPLFRNKKLLIAEVEKEDLNSQT